MYVPAAPAYWCRFHLLLTQSRVLKQAAAAKKTEIFERAERYVKEYRAQENDSIRFRREAKAAGNIHVPAEVRK